MIGLTNTKTFAINIHPDLISPSALQLFNNTSFTRSDGTLFARIYERLTKASRRRNSLRTVETAYRRGVKDALEALRTELN